MIEMTLLNEVAQVGDIIGRWPTAHVPLLPRIKKQNKKKPTMICDCTSRRSNVYILRRGSTIVLSHWNFRFLGKSGACDHRQCTCQVNEQNRVRNHGHLFTSIYSMHALKTSHFLTKLLFTWQVCCLCLWPTVPESLPAWHSHLQSDLPRLWRFAWSPYLVYLTNTFLAASKQLYEWYILSVCHTCFTIFPSSHHHEIFMITIRVIPTGICGLIWQIQTDRYRYQWPGWGPCKRSRSQGSKPNFSVSGP